MLLACWAAGGTSAAAVDVDVDVDVDVVVVVCVGQDMWALHTLHSLRLEEKEDRGC